MKISCFLLLMFCLYFSQIHPVAGYDTIECLDKKAKCQVWKCPWFYVEIGTCFEGRGKCCQKTRG
ncbi:beta-defensin 38 [Phodopus roborovskii]|uniref:Beta-defensin 1 n=1 Tax=Phodopus roborovskii TaxID=109678 RepID=A0AAU9Z300_PHORO|nr:beta-defensin 38 [Phodopus roborovskii]CAH6787089.1 Defb38 [Phodopus roborovskii]